jgi:hypothetical protein
MVLQRFRKVMITIFGSSTAYISFPDRNKSYVHLLRESGKTLRSYCSNGYTIWHANYMLPKILPERSTSQLVILHVGASEVMTMKLTNFLVLASYWLHFGEVDHYFKAFISPKIHKAACALHDRKELYLSLLTLEETELLFEKVLGYLNGYKIIVMGMSRPIDDVGNIRLIQAEVHDKVIKDVCTTFPEIEFMDVFNLCSGKVVDSTHLNEEGHRILYNEIVKRIP